MDFSGTVTASYGTYIAMAVEILDSVAHHGFSKFLILNAQGGNCSILDVALGEFSRRRADAEAALRESPQIDHACELETCLMLAASPGLVRRDQIESDGLWPESAFLYQDMLRAWNGQHLAQVLRHHGARGHGVPGSRRRKRASVSSKRL